MRGTRRHLLLELEPAEVPEVPEVPEVSEALEIPELPPLDAVPDWPPLPDTPLSLAPEALEPEARLRLVLRQLENSSENFL